jgi:hypothetical protein
MVICAQLILTNWKFPLVLISDSIMSKKMGMVAFLSSSSGTKVTFRKGPIREGIK